MRYICSNQISERPLLVNCSFIVIHCIWAGQLYCTTFDWLLLENFGKWIKNNKRDIFNLKTPKKSLKKILNTQELNSKDSIKSQKNMMATVARQLSHSTNVYYCLGKTWSILVIKKKKL